MDLNPVVAFLIFFCLPFLTDFSLCSSLPFIFLFSGLSPFDCRRFSLKMVSELFEHAKWFQEFTSDVGVTSHPASSFSELTTFTLSYCVVLLKLPHAVFFPFYSFLKKKDKRKKELLISVFWLP